MAAKMQELDFPTFEDKTFPKNEEELLRDVFSFSFFSVTALSTGVSLFFCKRAWIEQADPVSLVLVQVVQHGLAEQARVSKAVPFFKKRLSDARNKTWNTMVMNVTQTASHILCNKGIYGYLVALLT